MCKRDRLRCVVILCCRFGANLAYYRTGFGREHRRLFDHASCSNFWVMANNNFLNTCVLEWRKLFADRKGQYHWRRIVTERDQVGFNRGLLDNLGLDETAFQSYIDTMRTYRDKFVAHLDSENNMTVPALDAAKKAVWFYHSHVVNCEAAPGDLAGLGLKLDEGYEKSEEEAKIVFRSCV